MEVGRDTSSAIVEVRIKDWKKRCSDEKRTLKDFVGKSREMGWLLEKNKRYWEELCFLV